MLVSIVLATLNHSYRRYRLGAVDAIVRHKVKVWRLSMRVFGTRPKFCSCAFRLTTTFCTFPFLRTVRLRVSPMNFSDITCETLTLSMPLRTKSKPSTLYHTLKPLMPHNVMCLGTASKEAKWLHTARILTSSHYANHVSYSCYAVATAAP